MYLNRITFTGADDTIAPRDLLRISELYPFVEWGILFHQNHSGTPRYPSLEWVNRLMEEVDHSWAKNRTRPKLCAHLCGQMSRDVLAGDPSFLESEAMGMFQRVQLNGWSEQCAADNIDLRPLAHIEPYRFYILQVKNAQAIDAVRDWQFRVGNLHVLFDQSAGRGILPEEWPEPNTSLYFGYAGGLTPGNVVRQVEKMAEVTSFLNFFIDMESGIRSVEDGSDYFDTAKVMAVIDQLKPNLGHLLTPKGKWTK